MSDEATYPPMQETLPDGRRVQISVPVSEETRQVVCAIFAYADARRAAAMKKEADPRASLACALADWMCFRDAAATFGLDRENDLEPRGLNALALPPARRTAE